MTLRTDDPLNDQRVLIDACLLLGVPYFWQGPGTLLISGAGAGRVLEEVESRGRAVIGLDGFELEGAIVRPRIDLIYDGDRAERGGPIAVAAEWGDDVWLDIALLPRDA